MNRKTWLSIRDNGGPLTKRLRMREVMIHQSTPGYPGLHGIAKGTRDLGRNKAKREARKGPRKSWRWIGRAPA